MSQLQYNANTTKAAPVMHILPKFSAISNMAIAIVSTIAIQKFDAKVKD